MIYFIIFFIAVIMLALNFIAGTFETLIQLEHKTKFDFGPVIIEKVYRPVDFRYSFQYATEEAYQDFRFYPDHGMKMIHDEKHKEYVLKDAVYKLAQDMFDHGVIEVNEDSVNGHPYIKRVDMKVKVYKPE